MTIRHHRRDLNDNRDGWPRVAALVILAVVVLIALKITGSPNDAYLVAVPLLLVLGVSGRTPNP